MSTVLDRVELQRGTGKHASYFDLLDASDQRRIRADLTTFFGPRADIYLDVYEKMRAAPTLANRARVRTWSWPVFLGSFTWFFYRKMYLYGGMLIILPMILSYLFGSAGSATSIIFAMWAKGWYVRNALSRIAKANKLGLTGAERIDYLRKAGGVSLTAGIFAGLIYAIILAVVFLGAIARHKVGH